MNATEINIAELKTAIVEWLTENDMRPEKCIFYTQEEWIARGEDIGTDAFLSANIEECGLSGLLNNIDCPDESEIALENDFYNMLLNYGCYGDLGYGWSIHFYEP